MYKRILVPVDGSPAASRALAEAIELAGNQGAEIQLLHVIDEWKVAAGDVAGVNLEYGARRLREAGGLLLQEAEAHARAAGIAVRSVLLEGMGIRVGSCVVQRAREWPADLIVCGTHGRRGIRRLLMGSDAEYILRHTPVPVLLLRSPDGNGPG
jgi:nucleotide-binding universal stress UspA family protein